jgi:hypothetical protein
MITVRTLTLALAVLTFAWGCASAAAASSTAAPAAATEMTSAATESGDDALYTTAQARRGEAVYDRVCLECHTRAEFRERPFLFAWEGTSVGQVYRYVAENMPDDGPGSLPEASYLDAMAYILEMNGYPAGDSELTADMSRMDSVPFEAHGSSRP